MIISHKTFSTVKPRLIILVGLLSNFTIPYNFAWLKLNIPEKYRLDMETHQSPKFYFHWRIELHHQLLSEIEGKIQFRVPILFAIRVRLNNLDQNIGSGNIMNTDSLEIKVRIPPSFPDIIPYKSGLTVIVLY